MRLWVAAAVALALTLALAQGVAGGPVVVEEGAENPPAPLVPADAEDRGPAGRLSQQLARAAAALVSTAHSSSSASSAETFGILVSRLIAWGLPFAVAVLFDVVSVRTGRFVVVVLVLLAIAVSHLASMTLPWPLAGCSLDIRKWTQGYEESRSGVSDHGDYSCMTALFRVAFVEVWLLEMFLFLAVQLARTLLLPR